MLKWLLLIILLSADIASARLYCAQKVNGCHETDYACQMATRTLKNIFDAQEKWSEFFNVDASGKDYVFFEAKGRYCRHLRYNRTKLAEISMDVLIDTDTHKKYRVNYTACGKENFFTENWEIKGEKLPALTAEKRREIYLHKKRNVTLGPNETSKDFYITTNVNRFVVPKEYISFGSMKANIVFRSTYTRFLSVNRGGKATEKVQSYVWLFDKKLFSQTTDVGNNNNYKFYFNSPWFTFAKRGSENRDICYDSKVLFSNDEKGRSLIHSSKSGDKFGMSYETFKKDCAQRETLWYLDRSRSLFRIFFESNLPRFSSAVAEDKNKKLKKEIELLLSFVEAGDRENTLLRVRQLLQDVKNNKILDQR